MPAAASTQGDAPPSRLGRLGRALRRHPYLVAFVLLLLAIRIALPYVLRPILEDQISALLNGRIAIEDISLSLLRGEAIVEGVGVYQGDGADVVVSFNKLLANIRWTALPFSEAIVEEVRLVSPRITVVRGENGEINLAHLLAPSPPAAKPVEEEKPAAEGEGGGWPVGLTRVTLEDADITFADRTLKNFKNVDFHIDSLDVERVAYGGSLYDQDGKVTLTADLAGAPLKIEADFAPDVLLGTSEGNIALHDLDVGLGSPYTAQLLGWSDLRGKLDVDLDFGVKDGDSHSPRVVLKLRDFSIAVTGDEKPALQWDSLVIDLGAVDPEQRSVDVTEVRLTNPVVRIRPADPQPLVLLSRMQPAAGAPPAVEDADSSAGDSDAPPAAEGAGAGHADAVAPPAPAAEREAPAGSAGDAPPPADEAAEPETAEGAAAAEAAAPAPANAAPAVSEPETAKGAAAAEAAAPPAVPEPRAPSSAPQLTWKLDKLLVEGAHVMVESPDDVLDVGLHVDLSKLTSEPDAHGDLKVATALAGGTLGVDGSLAVAPPSFHGGVDIADVDMPMLVRFVPDPRAQLLRGGVARSDLEIAFDVNEDAEDAPAIDATFSGTLGLAGLQVAGDDPDRFSLGWDDLDVDIDGVDVRDGVPAAEGGKPPIRIASIVLTKPSIRATRLQDGSIALPQELSDGGAAAEQSGGEDAEHGIGAEEVKAAAVSAQQVQEQAGSPAVEIAKVRVVDGRVRLVDRSVDPEVKPGVKNFDLSLDGVHMPERRIDRMEMSATGLRGGKIKASGKVEGEATDVVFSIDKYRLVPYDPYATSLAGYGIRHGMLTLNSKISLRGADFDTDSKVVVHRLGLKNVSAGSAFEDEIGVSMSLALALLKDPKGDIVLDVPVSSKAGETNVNVGAIVAQQLRRVLVNALASPLKLFGIGGGGDSIGDIAAVRMAFDEGAENLSAEGRAAAEKLAALLRERPELAVALDAKNSYQDTRPLQEASLLEDLRGKKDLKGDFATLRDYLEARTAGEEAELPPYLEPVLAELLSHRRPAKAQAEELAAARVEVVRKLMVDELHVRPEQVSVEDRLGRSGPVEGAPVVEAELGVVDEDDEPGASDGAAAG